MTQQQPAKRRSLRRPVLAVLCVALVLLIVAAVVAWRTMIHMPGGSDHGKLPDRDDAGQSDQSGVKAVPKLTRQQRLRRDVEHLAVTIGERNVYLPKKLAEAADFIDSELTAAGLSVGRQTYKVLDVTCCNLDAQITGTKRPEEIVLIGAHYDSVVGTPGANDNGSGVAGLLELARALAEIEPERSIRFVAFTNEEPPHFQTEDMGSRVYAKRCKERGEKLSAVLVLETIGYYSDEPGSQQYPAVVGAFYPSEGNFIGVVGNVSSRVLVRSVVESFRSHTEFPCEGAALPAAIPGVGFSDHWSFWQEGYQAVMLTDTAMFRYPHYHEPEDTPDKVDFQRLTRVMDGVQRVVAELATVSVE